MGNEVECYELTISENYVADWTFGDAIRELIQNGIDQETVQPNNKFNFEYFYSDNKIVMKNENAKLKIDTLLLGRSSKAKNDDTVGQFGEGYKIAALVLTRLGKTFTIYNNEKNEKWTCRFKNSVKWHSKMLAFYIEKNVTKDTGLEIVVGNVSDTEYQEASEMWLKEYMEDYEKIETEYGEILKEDELIGKVYVNGLFVYFDEELKHGYNFKPKYIKLERDRKTCDSWNIGNVTAKMVMEATVNGDISIEEMGEMMEKNAEDIHYVTYNKYSSNASEVAKRLIESFYMKNPDYAVPAYSNEQVNRIKAIGAKPVLVSREMADILSEQIENKIVELSKSLLSDTMTVKERLTIWINSYRSKLSSSAITEFESIIDKLD